MKSIILTLLLVVLPNFFYANDPIGWDILKQTIEKTSFNDFSKLKNRSFDLKIIGATNEYNLKIRPEEAFKVERLTTEKFKVTIVNPDALIEKDLIYMYKNIGWELIKEEGLNVGIEGRTNCLYNVTFSQTGGNEFDLTKFEANPDYDFSYELSNPSSIASIARAGKGYDIIRQSNNISDSKIRLKINKKSTNSNFQTSWISIPNCKAETITIPLTELEPEPEPKPEPETEPSEFLDIKINGITFCNEPDGTFCSTLEIISQNNSSRRIKCNDVIFSMKDSSNNSIIAKTTQWIDLDSYGTHTFYVTLKSSFRPSGKWSYTISKTNCNYK